MENPSYYSILTASVRYSKAINANEKLLFSEITALTTKEGYCCASNNYFAKLYNKTPQAISKWINNLKKENFITLKYLYKENSKEIKKRLIYVSIGVDRVSTNDCEGYQHRIKDSITSISNIYNIKEDNKSKSFSFTLSQKTQYENLSQEYKDNLKKEIESINGNLSYDDFILSLEAKGYQYKNFLSAYKQWNKNKTPKQQRQSNQSAFAMKEQRQQRQFISDNLISKFVKQGIGRAEFAKWYNDPQSAPNCLQVLKESGKFILIPTNEPQNNDNIIDTVVL